MIKKVTKRVRVAFSKKFKSDFENISKKYGVKSGDLAKCRANYIKYGFSPSEYYILDIENKDKTKYVSFYEMKEILLEGKNILPRAKYKRYLMFKDFYKRDVIEIDFKNPNENEYKNFIEKNPVFISKPIDGARGCGILKLSSDEVPTLQALQLKAKADCMCEGLIEQGAELSKFHESSVNSLRMISVINNEGKYTLLCALFRCGRGGAVVDNVGAGGLASLVDVNTGEIITDGTLGGKMFETHPDTGMKFKGFSIPKWNDLCRVTEEAHRSKPKQKLFGWDFAFTKNGEWDLIEVNPFPSIKSCQLLAGDGIRELFKEAGLL